MKSSPEFQPWRFLGFGSTIIFLLFFCTFCAWADPSSYEDWFDLDEDTTRRSGTRPTLTRTTSRTTGTGTGIGKSVPDSHVIGIGGKYRWEQNIECRGVDVSNLTVMPCDGGSILKCRNKLSCFINGTSCTKHDKISSGDTCFSRQTSHSQPMEHGRTEKCLNVLDMREMRGGIIKCTSFLPSSFSTRVQLNTNATRTRTTIDYFYWGVDSKVHLVSSPISLPNKTMIIMRILYIGKERPSEPEDEKTEPEVVYTNEQVGVGCSAISFFIDPKSIKLEARRKSGTEYQIDPALYVRPFPYRHSTDGFVYIQRFRVPKDVASISCVGRRLDTSEIVRTTTNIVVIDPPSPLLVKSPNGSEFQVNSKIGCNLSPSHTKTESQIIDRKLFNIMDISRRSEFWITSPISFLRFQNITQGNFSCIKLQPDGNSKSSSNDSSTENFDYYFDLEEKKPRIEKPNGVSTVVLSGHNHRSLVCKYTGNPMPYVIWLQNGKEIFYTIGTEISTDQPDVEEAVLRLPVKNLNNSTEISSDSNLKYSCVVQNRLGVDRLDFVIEKEKNSASQSNSKPEEKSRGLFYVGLISSFFILVLVGLGFYFIRGKHQTKRAVVTKFRGQHC